MCNDLQILNTSDLVPDNSAVIDGRHLVLGACGDALVRLYTPKCLCVPFLPRVPQNPLD
ncbi:hypothetical protein SCLCIDRAFT_1216722 [Scleroderma citrinum Foug A]|uniref:Uncharacterized protein n=1 Tax=Scleroderma citrinum Foug A TaxID=1036808 RepID=A0A0C3A6N1_9AGAM|nr:hypothetical protein SCLCIDRAFT_1216722 [Scleroderma citrinum Foug A]